MKIEVERAIAASPEVVFEAFHEPVTFLCLFKAVKKISPATGSDGGRAWTINAEVGGRKFEGLLQRTREERPNLLAFQTTGEGFEGQLQTQFAAAEAGRTQISATFTVQPKSVSARLLYPLALAARGAIESRLDARLNKFCKQIVAKARETS
jgi:uncharacterized protein YndB with AHSA1/START domain